MRDLLPTTKPLRRLAFATLVDAFGTGMFLAVAVLYLTRTAGFSPAAVTGGLSAAGLAAFVAAIPLGRAGDRVGHRRLWVALYLVQATVFALYPVIRDLPFLLAAMTAAALAEVGVSPARGACVAHLAGPENRVRTRAQLQAVTNIGFVAGAGAASLVLLFDTGYTALLLGNAVSYAIGAAVVRTLPDTPRGNPASRAVFADRRYLTFAALNGVLMCYLAIPAVALPLWIVHRTSAPAWTVGALMVLNTVLVVALQVRASRGAETIPGAARLLRRSGWALFAACLVFAVSEQAPLALVAGMVVLTVAELWQSAGAWGLSFALAPEDRQGEYLGAFAMGTRIYDSAGPALVTALTLGAGAFGWAALGVLFLVTALSAAARGVGGDVRPHGDQDCHDDEPGENERQHPETRVGEQLRHGEPPSTHMDG
jgi:MFS family permease